MDVRQLSYFLAVAEEQQFTRAAGRVSVAQPAVSYQIRRLEAELGERLFHRDRRDARLTAAGQELLPHARAAISAVERGRAAVASLQGLLHGTSGSGSSGLRSTAGYSTRWAPSIARIQRSRSSSPSSTTRSCKRRWPAATPTPAVIGITGEPLPPHVRTRVIATEPLVLAVRPDDPLARRPSVTFGTLHDRPLITLTPGSGLRVVLENACRDAGFTPRISAETSELSTLVELAVEGFGVALLPRSAVAGHEPRVAVLELTRPRLKRRTAIAWNDATISPARRGFLTLADAYLGSPGRHE